MNSFHASRLSSSVKRINNKTKDDTSRRLGLWAPGLNPSDPGVPGFVSLDSPFLPSQVENCLANVDPDSRVIVYAGALKALCAAQGLIVLGVAPSRISIIRPMTAGRAPGDGNAPTVGNPGAGAGAGVGAGVGAGTVWSLGDVTVDMAAAAAFVKAGIIDAGEGVLEGVRLDAEGAVAAAVFANATRLNDSDIKDSRRRREKGKAERARSGGSGGGSGRGRRGEEAKRTRGRNSRDGNVKEEGEEEEEEEDEGGAVRCGLLLCGDTPNADPDVFRAANNSGLVYDGRLVVDPMFRTSDPAVLAGGSLTKFSRVHGAGVPRHEKYNAREVC